MNVKEIGWKGVDWIRPAQRGHVASFCERGGEKRGFINLGNFLTL